jgi:hypothetical protein
MAGILPSPILRPRVKRGRVLPHAGFRRHCSSITRPSSQTYTGAMESQTLACRIGAGLSTSESAWEAAREAAREARRKPSRRADPFPPPFGSRTRLFRPITYPQEAVVASASGGGSQGAAA